MVEKIDWLIRTLTASPNLFPFWRAVSFISRIFYKKNFQSPKINVNPLAFLVNFIFNKFIKIKLLNLPILVLALVLVSIAPVKALPSFIADDETEVFLQKIIRPLFNTARIPFNANKVFIINDNSINAFVSNGNYMFIHTGTLINADNVNQLNGILAHEVGHIAGGHIVRQKLQVDKMKTLAVASLIAAGAAAAASGRGDAAMAVMLGSQSSLMNSMTTYQLQEERSADESAVKYLRKLNQSPQGLKDIIKKIQTNNRLNGYEEVPYFRTHPMSSERLRFFERAIASSSHQNPTTYDHEFNIIKAKLQAFLLPIDRGWQLYPRTNQTEAAQYAHAILHFRQNNLNQALKSLNTLIKDHPQNPYYHELKGQFLFESGKIKEALTSYQTALKLKPDSPEIILEWARAALEMPDYKNQLQNIINKLNQVQIKKPSLTAWILLARAYAENGQSAEALYASAHYSLAQGNLELARRQIEQAQKQSRSSKLNLKLKDLQNLLTSLENQR